jgi:hypothetical protein
LLQAIKSWLEGYTDTQTQGQHSDCINLTFIFSLLTIFWKKVKYIWRTRGNAVGWGTMLQAKGRTIESRWNGVKDGRSEGLTTLPLSLSRFSRPNVGASTSHNLMGLHGLLQW